MIGILLNLNFEFTDGTETVSTFVDVGRIDLKLRERGREMNVKVSRREQVAVESI